MAVGRDKKRAMTLMIAGGGLAGLLAMLLVTPMAPAAAPLALSAADLLEVAPQGFGDRQNSGAWSMAWWNGALYVGTVRAFGCWSHVWINLHYPFIKYPTSDPDQVCTPDATDLPLRAEIWRFTPATSTWARVYQSPNDVPIAGHAGKFTARDIGFRTMMVFPEPGGGEALYVGGAVANFLWPPTPLPRILRSTDGTSFAPVPQDPGTQLGELPNRGTFRSMRTFNGRFYVVNGTVQGPGVLLESDNPAGGNDNFRQVTPDGMQVFETAVFNGFLYLGVADATRGYAVVKTDATGAPPYRFTPVVTQAGFLQTLPRASVVSMEVHGGRLYVGTSGPVLFRSNDADGSAGPSELIRINPDDSWDLVMGTPRSTPTGVKEPTSGLGTGFDWILNHHVWRMQDHEGVLYVGTLDGSSNWKDKRGFNQLFADHFGFDLYQTEDGFYVTQVTRDGLGDEFQIGLRTFASTPVGLFAGSVSYWFGQRVYQGVPTPSSIDPVKRLEAEDRAGAPRVLSWDAVAGATRYRVYRVRLVTNLATQINAASRPEPEQIATTTTTTFLDRTAVPGREYHYFVVAQNAGGSSAPSNLARGPWITSPMTFKRLENTLLNWAGARGAGLVAQAVQAASALSQNKNFTVARADLAELAQMVEDDPTLLPAWRVSDLQILLGKLLRRMDLAEAGLISINALL